MAKINFDDFTAIPNRELESLFLNKSIPVKVRVRWVILRTILGFPANRIKMEAEIGRRFLGDKTGASQRQVGRVLTELRAESDGIKITTGLGRGNRSKYQLDLDKLGYFTSFDDDGKPHYKR